MAAWGVDASRLRNRPVGDTACQSGALSDDRENRPQGRSWDSASDPDGMVQARSCKIARIAGGASASGGSQTVAGQATGGGVESAWDLAKLRSEGRQGLGQ